MFEENWVRKITWLSWCHRFRRKAAFSKCSPSTRKRKARVFNVCGIKIVFKKLRLRDGLMWAVGLTVETKLRLQFLRHSMCGVLTLHLEPKQNSWNSFLHWSGVSRWDPKVLNDSIENYWALFKPSQWTLLFHLGLTFFCSVTTPKVVETYLGISTKFDTRKPVNIQMLHNSLRKKLNYTIDKTATPHPWRSSMACCVLV